MKTRSRSRTSTSSITSNRRLTSPLDAALVFGHGNFQRLVLVCATLSMFVSLIHSFGIVAMARPVEHWCKPPSEFANTPTDVWKNRSIPMEPDGTLSKCTRYEPPLDTANATVNRTVVSCDAWDYNLTTTGSSIVSDWNLVCDRRWLVSLQHITYLGGTVATMVTGYLGDRIGRKSVLIVALIVLLLSGTATIIASSVDVFTALRALTSTASLTVMNMASTLLFEVTETTHRVVLCVFSVCISSALVPPFILLLKNVSNHWIMAQAMLMIPTSFLLLAFHATEESPCWLLAMGNIERTERVVLSAARTNGLHSPDVKVKLGKLKYELLRRGGIRTERSSPLDLILSASLRRRAITIFSCWFVVLLHAYDTTLNPIFIENNTTHILYIILRIPVPIALMYILHRHSRRWTLCVTMMHMSVVMGFEALLIQQKDVSFLVVAATVFLGGFMLDAMLMTVFVYTLEIFPTSQRSLGLSCSVMMGRFGVIITPFIKEPNPRINRSTALAVSAVALALLGVAVLWLPETTEVRATNTIREAELEDKWHPPSTVGGSQRPPRKSTKPFDAPEKP